MQKRFIFAITSIAGVLLLAVFSIAYWNFSRARVNKLVQDHCKIVARSIWDLNTKTSEEYLRMVARHNNYKSITIIDDNNDIFARVAGPGASRLDSLLISLHLIPEEKFSGPIVYNNHTLGRTVVVWRNRSIYVFLLASLITSLLLSTMYMYLRLLDSNRTLEQKVQDRTRTLQESEQKFRALFDNHYQLTGLVSPEGKLLSANQASLELGDCTEEEIIGQPFCDCPWWPPGSPLHDPVKNAVKEARQGKFVRIDLNFKDRDGQPRVFDFSLTPVFNSANELIYLIPEGRDITSLKQAQLEKVREQLFTEAVIESLPGIFYVCNERLELIRWNKNLERTSGYSPQELLHKSVFSFFDPEDQERVRQRLNDRINNLVNTPAEFYALNKDGSRIPFLFSSSILTVDESKYLIGTGTDIRDRKKIELELQHARKMEALGTLAGGIAHDFNNILSAIIGYTELSQLEAEPGSRIAGFLSAIHQASLRARDLVQQILIFSRKHDKNQIPVKIAALVAEALRLIRSSIPATIDIQTAIDADETIILADPTRIHQVIVNLCTNAYQAIGEHSGTLEINLQEVVLEPDEWTKELNLPPGKYVRLQVTDNGPGINEKTLERIFEPYFTTKETGKGTGLGLAMVDSIVKEHKGIIHVESVVNKGTTFTVYLPILENKQRETTFTDKPPLKAPSAQRHIVCVDDEPYILNILQEFLQEMQYSVTVFDNGADVLTYLDAPDRRVDMVITDMTMPLMTGLELGRKILGQQPDLPVILCTGYSQTINEEQILEEGFAAYLEKPVILADLAVVIQELLAATEEEG